MRFARLLCRLSPGATTATVLLLLAGCANPRHTPPAVDPATLSDDAFTHYLAGAPVVTVDEAYRAMLILADGEDKSKTFAEREQELVSRGIASAAWKLQPDNVIDQGAVAAMVCRVLHLKGGINLIIFGSFGLGDRRYANRELIFREMLPSAPDYMPVRGGTLLALTTKADAYMTEHGLFQAPAIKLGTEHEAVEMLQSLKPPATQPGR